jgi:hypothetical protein
MAAAVVGIEVSPRRRTMLMNAAGAVSSGPSLRKITVRSLRTTQAEASSAVNTPLALNRVRGGVEQPGELLALRGVQPQIQVQVEVADNRLEPQILLDRRPSRRTVLPRASSRRRG